MSFCQKEVTVHGLPATVKRRLLDMVYQILSRGGYSTWSTAISRTRFVRKMNKTKKENAKKGNMCLFFHIIDSQTKFSR